MIYNYLNKNYKLKAFYFSQDNYYEIRAYDEHMNVVAYVNFKISKNRDVWLNYIETKDSYQHQGYATVLIRAMEFLLIKLRANYIEGNYFPKNKNAKKFYEKNGYKICKEGYDTLLSKYLDYEKVKKEIEPFISNFEIIKLKNDKDFEK